MTINARSEDDVDEDAIKEQVSRASGSNYSIHKEKAKPVPEPKPVVGFSYIFTFSILLWFFKFAF